MPKWLSKDAERVLRVAEQEARLRRQAVGTPHLLLGLVNDERGKPAAVLESMGISVRQVQYESARKIGRVSGKAARRRPVRSTRVDGILRRALDDATADGRGQVEPEDLLLALVAEPEGKAAAILARLRPTGEDDPDVLSAAF